MYIFQCYSIHPPSPPTVSVSLFSLSASPLLRCTQVHQYYLSRFHIYALIYDICFSSFWLTSFCIIGSRFTHLIRTDSNTFLFMAGNIPMEYYWDGWMESQIQWTWTWANSRRWWERGKPGVLPSMGSWRVRHDLATEQQQQQQQYVPQLLYPFICQSTSGFVHVLAIANSAAMSIGVCMSFSVTVSSGHMISSGIVSSYGSFIPRFLRNVHTILHSGWTTCIPTNSVGGFPFLYILSSIYCL